MLSPGLSAIHWGEGCSLRWKAIIINAGASIIKFINESQHDRGTSLPDLEKNTPSPGTQILLNLMHFHKKTLRIKKRHV